MLSGAPLATPTTYVSVIGIDADAADKAIVSGTIAISKTLSIKSRPTPTKIYNKTAMNRLLCRSLTRTPIYTARRSFVSPLRKMATSTTPEFVSESRAVCEGGGD